jgi:hypothetical protein
MSLLDQLKDPKLLPLILGGAGAAGIAGGALTAGTPLQPNETPGQRRMRILRNGLLSAAAGGGAVALGGIGSHALTNALPAGDVDPITSAVTSPLTRLGASAATWGGLNARLGHEVNTARQSLAQKLYRGAPNTAQGNALRNYLRPIGTTNEHVNPNLLDELFNQPGGNPRLPGVQPFLDRQNTAVSTLRNMATSLSAQPGAADEQVRKALLEAGFSPSQGRRPIMDLLERAGHRLGGSGSDIAVSGRRMTNPLVRTALAAAALGTPEILQGGAYVGGQLMDTARSVKDHFSPPPDYSS